MRIIHGFLICLIVPYVLLFIDGLVDYWLSENVNDIVFAATVYLSTPGLILIGFLLCSRPRKVDRILGVGSIILAILYLIILFWVFSRLV